MYHAIAETIVSNSDYIVHDGDNGAKYVKYHMQTDAVQAVKIIHILQYTTHRYHGNHIKISDLIIWNGLTLQKSCI